MREGGGDDDDCDGDDVKHTEIRHVDITYGGKEGRWVE